ncbi:hypothetical protein [Streptomyces sp. NPDC057686]|uniref:hypothetical protein n=1 Tax=Streptomyces sp. NPDC057686 TaxID=3346212 RepID=UPI0036A27AE2
MRDPASFTSASVPRHLLRGTAGFGALAGSILLIPLLGPGSLVVAAAGLFALRGCPMCWAVGLVQMLSAGRLRRTCTDGRCELRKADAVPADRRGGDLA